MPFGNMVPFFLTAKGSLSLSEKGMGAARTFNNYCSVTLLSVPCKVLAHLLFTYVQSLIEVVKTQTIKVHAW